MLDVAFSKTLNAVNRTTDVVLAPIRAAVEEGPPAGDRKRLPEELQSLKVLSVSVMKSTGGSRKRLWYMGTRLAYYLATVERLLWYTWTSEKILVIIQSETVANYAQQFLDDYQNHALNKLEQAYNDPACPDAVKEAL